MPVSAQRFFRSIGAVTLLLAVLAVCNAPLLDTLIAILRLDGVAHTADAHTHYLRMLHTRDLYLPSGHHWGWEPFWFQGYVPFLLYPHLLYVALALVAMVPGLEAARVFNAATVALYLALPLAAAVPVLRARGLGAALIVTAWLAELSSVYGAGLRGVLNHGLLSQQAGACLFTIMSVELLVTRRRDRAAIWLGLIALVHVHTTLIAGLVWSVEGLLTVLRRSDEPGELRSWCADSAVAALIACPTLVGLVLGWGQLGGSTSFQHPPNMTAAFLRGLLVGPSSTVFVIVAGAVAGVAFARPGSRVRLAVALGLGIALTLLGLQNLDLGVGVPGRILRFVLRLRTLPYAYIWLAVIAVAGWAAMGQRTRGALAVATAAAVVFGWAHDVRFSHQIGTVFPRGAQWRPIEEAHYLDTLRWVDRRVGKETTTVAVVVAPGMALARPMRQVVEALELPALGGHGIELTDVRNARLLIKPEHLTCKQTRRFIHEYVVGFVMGKNATQRDHYERCLERTPDFERGLWWAYDTGRRWQSFVAQSYGFTHDPTWTVLTWHLQQRDRPATVRLPLANTAPWAAYVDNTRVAIGTTYDSMMSIDIPAGTRRLLLAYVGPPGEWASVAIAALGLVLGLVRIVRRRTLLRAVLLLPLLLPAITGCERSTPSPRPDILLVTIDTLRADHTSAYGYFVDTTPTLRRLAARGILFRRAYAPSATTGPSHAALFAGRPARSVGVMKNGHVLHERFTTLAEVLTEGGYQTAAFVSSGPVHAALGYGQGFETYDERKGDGRYLKKDGTVPRARRADETTEAVIEWLDRRTDDRPLFVWMHLFDPHSPYDPPEPFEGGWQPDTPSVIERYDSEIRFADSRLADVVDRMEEQAGHDGTITVVTADHGEAFGEHNWRGHGANLHEEAVRVPLILGWPGHLTPREVAHPAVSVVDVAPTLLHLLRMPIPEEFGGRILTSPLDRDRPVFVQRRDYSARHDGGKRVRGEMVAVVHGRWKFLRAPDEKRRELYYLEKDPEERFNLARRVPGKRAELDALIRAWLREHPRLGLVQPEPSAELREELRALGYVD